MPRQQFNKQTALESSVAVFWQQGFHGTSMLDILEATQLKPGSIYHAFENKEGLFKASLKQYFDTGLAQASNVMNNSPTVGIGICSILKKMIKESAKDNYCSCFLIKSQLEITENQTDLNSYITLLLEKTKQNYLQFLLKEYDPQTAQTHATSLMVHIFGIRVYGYQKKNTKELLASVKQGLDWLPWDK